jgi:hypothetical protein
MPTMTPTKRGPVQAEPCDRCGAPSHVRVTHNESTLTFCGHHGRPLLVSFERQGWRFEFASLLDHVSV